MSLIYCPECGNEISDAALACPNCGRPINAVPAIETTVIRQGSRRDNEDIPRWVYIPLGIIGGVALLLLFVFFVRNSSGDESNLNVKVSADRPVDRRDTTRASSDTAAEANPSVTDTPLSTDSQTVTVPGTEVATTETRGSVVVDAKVTMRNGQTRPVRNEKFYLLDEDIESILSNASLEPIDGQSLINSFGLSVSFPDRYGDFNRRALAAIRPHIKHSALSNAAGQAEFGNIEPDSYYLFGITRNEGGFAFWSSPVSIRPGENVLNLSPQPLTKISGDSNRNAGRYGFGFGTIRGRVLADRFAGSSFELTLPLSEEITSVVRTAGTLPARFPSGSAFGF